MLFLAGRGSAMVTGHVLAVDGGISRSSPLRGGVVLFRRPVMYADAAARLSRLPALRRAGAGRPVSTAVVVGAGAMGAAAARVLAERGWAVTLIEQHHIGHDLGGSGHETRSFRLSHSDAADVRLAVRALELWNDLEQRSGVALLRRGGLLQRGSVVPPMAAALREAGVRYDELDHRDVTRLFPEMRPQPDAPAIFQPDGAVIFARRSIEVQVELAVAAGAIVHEHEKCVALSPQGDGVRVFTRRRRIDADVAVVCAGPWSLPLLAPLGLRLPLQAGLAQVTSFRSLYPGWEQRPGTDGAHARTGVYGMPEHGRGYKLGWATANPMTFWKESKVRPLRPRERARARRARARGLPRVRPDAAAPRGRAHHARARRALRDRPPRADRRRRRLHRPRLQVLARARRIVRRSRRGAALPPEALRFRLDRPTLAPERRNGPVAVGA